MASQLQTRHKNDLFVKFGRRFQSPSSHSRDPVAVCASSPGRRPNTHMTCHFAWQSHTGSVSINLFPVSEPNTSRKHVEVTEKFPWDYRRASIDCEKSPLEIQTRLPALNYEGFQQRASTVETLLNLIATPLQSAPTQNRQGQWTTPLE